jgi:hypothetical protein
MFLSFCFHHGRVAESFNVGIFQSSAALASLRRRQYSLQLHGRKYGGQISHTHQIVGGTGEGKNPMDFAHPSMAHLAHERDRLQPAEAFLDPLSLSLTERIPSMSYGAAINGAATCPVPRIRNTNSGQISQSVWPSLFRYTAAGVRYPRLMCSLS